ncbi:MAG: 30S ribosomal protein S27ae [Candidatus Bathyarchaeia archaeon]|nr:30S ribosomal protein S27ae [Candidatus Bathyarchaeota archaeon]
MSGEGNGGSEAKARISRIYEYDYEKGIIRLKNRKCPRCGNIMAHHEAPVERWMCGGCHYTEIAETGVIQR